MADIELIKSDLSQSDLFFEMDQLLIELIASICDERTYEHNEIIFEENSDQHELYIIAYGEVEIKVRPGTLGTGLLNDPKHLKTIATLRRGQNFGEVALVDDGRRTAAAVCAENKTRLLVIPREKLLMMCENVPKLGYLLMRGLAADLATKIRSADLDIRDHLTWVPQNKDQN